MTNTESPKKPLFVPPHDTDWVASSALNAFLLALTDAYTEMGMIGVLDKLYKTADDMRALEVTIARQKGNDLDEKHYSEALLQSLISPAP